MNNKIFKFANTQNVNISKFIKDFNQKLDHVCLKLHKNIECTENRHSFSLKKKEIVFLNNPLLEIYVR